MILKKLCLFFLAIGLFTMITPLNAIGESINYTSGEAMTVFQSYRTHTVTKGETAYSIASSYNTTVKDIYNLNPKAEKGIKTGDLLRIPTTGPNTSTGYKEYTIKSQETLYGISRQYGVSIEDIVNANPGLNESSFKAGKSIRIPVYGNSSSIIANSRSPYKEYIAKKGETVYRIGKDNGIPEDVLIALNPILKEEGLKEGMALTIPQKTDNFYSPQDDDVIRIGILFPFLETNGTIQQDKLIEYYEGLLLAVKDVKEKGLSAEIYTFDIGSEKDTKKLENILTTNEMKNLSLIIGGISKQQIDILSKYAKKTGAKYVVPFNSQISDINMNPNIFQVTTPPSGLFSEIAAAFHYRFDDRNIIFVSEIGSDNNKTDFTSILKKELTKYNIPFKTIGSSSNAGSELKQALDHNKENIIIPTSSSEASLRRLIALVKPESNVQISLFGYPEWQTYTALNNDLHNLDTYIYSIFYFDPQQYDAQRFTEQFRTWYNKDLINSYPRFGALGYDTGLYFLSALNKYGKFLGNNLYTFSVPTIQSAIHFNQTNNKGGYINNGFYFVHYKPDSTIEKIDCTK